MKKQPISYDEYKEEIMRIYRDLRREGYYYNLLINLFEECITKDMKVIPVYLNTGYKDDGKKRLHDRLQYADSHSLQDIIIVPHHYTYENTTKPYVSIEIKKPNFLQGGDYRPVDIKKYDDQLYAEFHYCKYIIFTDCISWYFLEESKKTNNPDIYLYDDIGWKKDVIEWEKLKLTISEFIKGSVNYWNELKNWF